MLNYFDLDLDERRLDKPFAVSSKSFTPTKISNADLANEISLVCELICWFIYRYLIIIAT